MGNINKTKILNIVSITNNLRLLYVEDNKESREQAYKLFKNYFSNIDIAVDGEEGLEYYKNYNKETNKYYDLIITDIEMPNMNGIDMSKAIYKINEKQIIIVVSAYSDKKYFIDLINIGIEGFIQKPLSFDQVLDTLYHLCEKFENKDLIKLDKECIYNKSTKELYCENEKISLTINESKFITFLMDNINATISSYDIFNYIYYDEFEKEFSLDVIKGLVKRLRKKLPSGLLLHNRVTGYHILTLT